MPLTVLSLGEVTPAFGVTLPTNDLIWWVPFTLILLHAARVHGRGGGTQPIP